MEVEWVVVKEVGDLITGADLEGKKARDLPNHFTFSHFFSHTLPLSPLSYFFFFLSYLLSILFSLNHRILSLSHIYCPSHSQLLARIDFKEPSVGSIAFY